MKKSYDLLLLTDYFSSIPLNYGDLGSLSQIKMPQEGLPALESSTRETRPTEGPH